MTFCARLRRQSAVWHLWEQQHRLGGLVCEIQFSRVAPGEYVTKELTADQVKLLRNHDSVLVEAMTQPIQVAPMPIVHEINNHDFYPPTPQPTPAPTVEERRNERQSRLHTARKKAAFDKYGNA